jgi:hypothetical protein
VSGVRGAVKDKKKDSSPALPVAVTDAEKAPPPVKPLPEDITQDLYKKEPDFTTPTESMDLDQREVSNVWKLKSESGLIYDFQSLHDLQKWARGRGNLKKMQISRDGNMWKAYEEYSQLIRLTASKEPPGGISLGKGVLGPMDQKPSLLTTIPGMSQQVKEPAVPPISRLPEESNVLITARTGAVIEKRFSFDVISFVGGLIIGIVVMFALFYFKII